jgi:hypothetical protein
MLGRIYRLAMADRKTANGTYTLRACGSRAGDSFSEDKPPGMFMLFSKRQVSTESVDQNLYFEAMCR